MMKHYRLWSLSIAVAAVALTGASHSETSPFGDPDSVSYAGKLWKELDRKHLVGAGATLGKHYQGVHPHGMVLDTIEGRLKVKGHKGHVIVKRNYGGDGVSTANVANDPDQYLQAVTVMFRRKPGYDPENKDWFWAKYTPTGEIMKNPKGMQLAGRVAKGESKGCIACHKSAPGGDMVYLHDRLK